MNQKTLKWIIYISGGICLYIFVAVRILPLFNALLAEKLIPGYWDKTRYGECYYFSCINHFKEKGLPEAVTKFQFSSNQSSLNEADVLIFGDSFFDISRGTQFPTLLFEKTSLGKMHYVYQELPLSYLEKNNYEKGKPKILILGLTERYIPFKFAKKHTSDFVTDARSEIRKSMAKFRDYVFYARSEELCDALLKRSYATSWLYSKIATLKFDLFGYISDLTPKYHADADNPWLFYYDQVNKENTSFYYKHTEEEIQNICENIEYLSNHLKERYNIEMYFLPIPAQYTLYHYVINNDTYNNFLPSLYLGLNKTSVRYIPIYDKFKKSNDILYYGTDGHWNVKGLSYAVELVSDYLQHTTPQIQKNANSMAVFSE